MRFASGPHNLRDDLGETTNLVERYPEKTQELLERLERWRDQLGAPVPFEANPQYDAEAEKAALQRWALPIADRLAYDPLT